LLCTRLCILTCIDTFSRSVIVIPKLHTGSELTINYGDWDFNPKKEYKRPKRTPEWLAENGWCIDHLEVVKSTLPGVGRGAFVKRNLPAGTMVAPAPLQVFKDRKVFQSTNPEQLYVNYCMQPRNSKMLVYPYGPGVNLINHASKQPANVHLQWSTNYMHKKELLDMDYDEFWENVNPGSLVLEVVASRDLVAGEELFLDYGPEWEAAWVQHVAKWEPLPDAQSYVYPEDMDETAALRTVKEQETEPYPSNLITMCFTPEWDRKKHKHVEWYDPEWDWAQGMVFCNILDRQLGADGNDEYTVSLNFFDVDVSEPLVDEEIAFDQSVPLEDLSIDTKVPRRAIRWIEKPYLDDEHLPNAFRHPIGLPDNLVPDAWRTAV
jgi:SET domain